MKVSAAFLACLAVSPVFAQLPISDLEAITGGTFLNFRNKTTGEDRNGVTISPLTLGADVTDPRSGASVNWRVEDTSDSAFFVGGQSVEDDNRRSGLVSGTATPVEPVVGTSYNPFSVTLSGLTAGTTYSLKVVAAGRRSDPVSDPSGLLQGLRPDAGIYSYDFSYGSSAGSLTTVANTAAGTLLKEAKAGSPLVVGTVSYYYYTGSYACDIGNWTADGSGNINLYLGEGAVNTVLTGARTMLDGLVIAPVPEPQMLVPVALGLVGMALIRRRNQSV